MNRIIASFFVVGLLLSSTPVSLAQESEPAAPQANSPLNCSDYYRFGSVTVELEPSVQTTVPGSLMTFAGVIKNANAYPLLDGTLYVKIFKRNNRTFEAGDGNEVVDQFVAKDNLTLRANGTMDTTFTWKVPMNAEGGEYYAAYFYSTQKRYDLAGLSYTDEVVGGQASFTIRNDAGTTVAKLSKLDTTLNDQNYFFKAPIDSFRASETVTVETTVVNPTDEEKRMPLQWNQYSGTALNPDNLRHTKTELVTVPANSEKTISYEVRPQPESTIYVTAVTQDRDVKSILNLRYTREGIEETTLNFSGLSAFPLSKDSEATLVACAQATTDQSVPGNIVTLSLKDKDGKVLHEYRYEGDIAAARAGFGESFTPTTNINFATLTTTLERNGVVVEEVTQVYDCETIDPASCLPEEGLGGFLDFLKTYFMQILLTGVIVVLIVAIIVYLKKRPRRENINAMDGPGTTSLLLLFTLMAGSVLFAQTAFAQQGPCILGPEEVVGGQDGFVDQSQGSACNAQNYIEPPSGNPYDHQSGSFYGACYRLGEGDLSTVGGCISRVKLLGSPAYACEVYGHYCAQAAGTGSCGPIGYDATSFSDYNAKKQQCINLGYTELQFDTDEDTGDIGNANRATGCLVNFEQDPGFMQAHYEKVSCVAPPTGGSCTVTEILDSQEAYPRDCYSEDQGGNIGLPVCQEEYTSEGDVVTNQTDISNGRCVPARDLPIPDGGTCSWTQVTISCDAAAQTSCSPAGSFYLWNGQNWDDYSVEADNNWLTLIGVGISQPPSIDWITNRDRGAGVTFYGSGDPNDSGNRLQCAAADAAVCGDQSEFWGGGMNCMDSSPMFVTCGPNQMIEYDTTETTRSCPGVPPERGYTGIIGRCVPDASCQAGNGAPARPSITGPTTGVVNAVPPHTFTVTAADPESNNIRYGITDAACTTVYEWLPGNGVVPSGTPQNFERTFNADGSYSLYVLAEDEAGARSACAEHRIEISSANACTYDYVDGSDITDYDSDPGPGVVGSCRLPGIGTLPQCAAGLSAASEGQTAPPGPPAACKLSDCEKLRKVGPGCSIGATTDLKINASDGPLSVNRADMLTLTWDAANVSLAQCTLSGTGVPNGSMQVDRTGTMSIPASATDSYTVYCGSSAGESDIVSVTVVNRAPEAPLVSHPTGNAPFDTLTTFSIQGSDPDGDNVFYEVDWNTDDSDGFNTTTGGGVSNSIQMASNAFAASGPQRIRARTVDQPGGLRSGWTEYTITIDVAPAPVATLEAAINGGSFSSDDQTINPGDTVTMRWDSQNASSCTGSGSGFDTGGARSGADAVNTPAANSQTTFTATCNGPGGSGSESLTITTRQLPNLSQPNITHQLSSGFDPATGYYDYVDIMFNTQNTGGSDTRASANYEFKFDNGRDGYELTRTGSLGLFTVLQTVGRTERVPGPIEFGNSLAYVAVDVPLSSDGVVEETDENDNEREVLLTFLPPDPGLSITADRTQLREGEKTRLSWTTETPYAGLVCSVTGPNLNIEPSGTSGGPRETAPIMAKSVFTFTCTEQETGTRFSDSVSVETTGSIEET